MAAVSPSSPDNDPARNDTPSAASRRIRRVAVAIFWSVVTVLVLVVTLPGAQDGTPDGRRAPHAPQAAQSHPPREGRSSSAGRRSFGRHLPRSRPIRLLIPKISVNAPFTGLAIGRSGRLEPPPAYDTNLVGWYAEGASPGETGTSIIAGHVDTATSAAVFANLRELRKGDRFQVVRADGRKASFLVDSVETFDKDHFPSERVYRDTARAQARLITCAGDYDRQVKDYTANLVVFAHLV